MAGKEKSKLRQMMKPWWDMTADDVDACLRATEWCPADLGYFRGGGYSSRYITTVEMPMTMIRLNLVEGVGPVMQLAEGFSAAIPDKVTETLNRRTNFTWPTTWFVPRTGGQKAFQDVYSVMANWGSQPLRAELWPYRGQADHTMLHAAHTGIHA